MCQYYNDSVLEVNMFLLPEKNKVSVVISPATATMAKHT